MVCHDPWQHAHGNDGTSKPYPHADLDDQQQVAALLKNYDQVVDAAGRHGMYVLVNYYNGTNEDQLVPLENQHPSGYPEQLAGPRFEGCETRGGLPGAVKSNHDAVQIVSLVKEGGDDDSNDCGRSCLRDAGLAG